MKVENNGIAAYHSQLYDVRALPDRTVAVAVGIGLDPTGTKASGRSAANARTAAAVQNANYAKNLLMLSLNGNEHLTEARAMQASLPESARNVVMDWGLAPGQEDDTFKNMRRLRHFVIEHGWETVIICAHKHHARRCGWIARWALRGLGVQIITLYVPGPYDQGAKGRAETALTFWLREKLVWLYTPYHFLRNWNEPFQK